MNTADALGAKIDTLAKLRDIVRTMKALASVNMRQFEQAGHALNGYYQTVALALQAVLPAEGAAGSDGIPAAKPETSAVIIFGSDFGLCGHFNKNIVNQALPHLAEVSSHSPRVLVVAVGAKIATLLEESGHRADKALLTPGSAEGISDAVTDILLTLDDWQHEHNIGAVWLFYNRATSRFRYQQTSVPLLPIDQSQLSQSADNCWPSRGQPTFTLPRASLLSRLLNQYLFVAVFRAFAESLTSENSARLAAMQAAEKNIAEALDETRTDYRRLRQELITAEILDVVTGFEVSSKNSS